MIGFSFTQNNIEYVIVIPSVTYISEDKVVVGFQEIEVYDSTVMALLEAAVTAYQPGGSGGSYEDGYADGEAAMEHTIANSQAVTASLYKSKLASEDADISTADSTDIDGQGTIFSKSYQYLKTGAEVQVIYNNGYSAGESAGYTSGYSAGETAGYTSGYSAGETAGESTGYTNGQNDAASAQVAVAGQYKSKLSSEDADIAAADATTLVGQGTIFSESYQYLKTSAETQAIYNNGYAAGEAAAAGIPFTKDDLMSLTTTRLGGYCTVYIEGRVYNHSAQGQFLFIENSNKWVPIDYLAQTSVINTGTYYWYSDNNVYFSNGTSQQVWSHADQKFVNVTFTGLTSFDGTNVWRTTNNIYYSYNSRNYIFDESTLSWTPVTFTGLTNIEGREVWSHGGHVYYSKTSDQYEFDESTLSWTAKTWTGLTSFYGRQTWSDGTNTYYNYNTNKYVLDASTSTWSTKAWSGMPSSFNGNDTYTVGNTIYYSNAGTNKIVNTATSTGSNVTMNTYTAAITGNVVLIKNGTEYNLNDINMSFKTAQTP